jgi:hypothetical protein
MKKRMALLVGSLTLPTACGGEPTVKPVVPVLPLAAVSASAAGTPTARPLASAPSASAQPPSSAARCLDAEAARAAHACPPGPPVSFGDILRAESDELRKSAGKLAKKTPGRAFEPRPFTISEAQIIPMLQRYLCTAPSGAEETEVRYRLARTYFEASHWDEAAVVFHDSAGTTGSDVGPYAAQLSLESLNILGTEFHRPGCIDTLAERARQYHDGYCGPAMRPENQEMCVILGHVLQDVARNRTYTK